MKSVGTVKGSLSPVLKKASCGRVGVWCTWLGLACSKLSIAYCVCVYIYIYIYGWLVVVYGIVREREREREREYV